MNKELNVGNQVSAPSEEDLTQLVSCYENKQYAQTSDLAKEIIERYPQHQFTWKILGSALTQEGRVDEALEATKNAVQLAPGDADSHFNLGNLFFKLSQFNEAADSQLRAIELNQDDLQAYSALAKTFLILSVSLSLSPRTRRATGTALRISDLASSKRCRLLRQPAQLLADARVLSCSSPSSFKRPE